MPLFAFDATTTNLFFSLDLSPSRSFPPILEFNTYTLPLRLNVYRASALNATHSLSLLAFIFDAYFFSSFIPMWFSMHPESMWSHCAHMFSAGCISKKNKRKNVDNYCIQLVFYSILVLFLPLKFRIIVSALNFVWKFEHRSRFHFVDSWSIKNAAKNSRRIHQIVFCLQQNEDFHSIKSSRPVVSSAEYCNWKEVIFLNWMNMPPKMIWCVHDFDCKCERVNLAYVPNSARVPNYYVSSDCATSKGPI